VKGFTIMQELNEQELEQVLGGCSNTSNDSSNSGTDGYYGANWGNGSQNSYSGNYPTAWTGNSACNNGIASNVINCVTSVLSNYGL
jgi:hypothetical protein